MSSTGQPRIESFAKYGLLPVPNDASGLPKGFSRIKSKSLPFVLTGLNCSACHSSQITYQGHTMHIDGAPNLIDVEAFFRGAINALRVHIETDSMEQRLEFLSRFLFYNYVELEQLHKMQGASQPVAPHSAPKTSPSHNETLAYLKEKLGTLVRIPSSVLGPTRK